MKRREALLSRIGAIAAALMVWSAAGGVARADDKVDRARAHYQRGVELFDQGSYKAAIAEFAAADGIAPSPILEYNMALCYDRLGDHGEALRRYRLYLRRVPDARNRAEVEDKIARLEKELATESGDSGGSGDPGTGYQPLPDDGGGAGPGDSGPGDSGPGDSGDPVDPGGDAGEAGASGDPGPAPTGDSELDRVAQVDVGAVRDRRAGDRPDPGAGAAGASRSDGEPPAAPPAAPADDPDEEPSPIYKRWWFWVVVGVSAIILIDIATSDGDDDSTAVRALDPSLGQRLGGGAASPGGFTIRF